jgi:hypothetical protein
MHPKLSLTTLASALGLALAGVVAVSVGSAEALDNDNCDRESGNLCFEAIRGHEFVFNPGVGFTTAKGTLAAQSDGNLVLKDERGQVRWATNTHGNPGAYAVFQEDGNLVVYANQQPIWASKTEWKGAYLVLQTDGNLVIYDASNQPIWASDTGH